MPRNTSVKQNQHLARRATALAADSLAPHHHDAGYHESGRDAFVRGVLLAECPWRAGPEQDDWIRGWLQAARERDEQAAG